MKKLTVSSLPLRNVISDIAREMDTDYTKSCGMFLVKIPKNFGEGIISGTDFDDGLGLIRYDCVFFEDTEIEYSVDKVHPVKFLYCLEGEINHRFINEDTWHEIPRYKNAIVASSQHHGHCVRFFAGERMVYNSLELNRRKFQGKISCEPTTIAQSWRNMLNDVTAKKTFYHDGFYSLRLSKILEGWDELEDGDWLKKLNLEGVAYKILVLQVKQFQDDLKSEGSMTLLRKSELKQLLNAVHIIENQLEDLPTIGAIAREIGLNPNKLQQGFKEVYGKTVNVYIRNRRLETARTLLLNTDHTLSAITQMVGYRSQSYLSKMFREHYGIIPSEFRQNRETKRVLPNSFYDLEGSI